MRSPSRVRKSSTVLMYFDPVPISEPKPPVDSLWFANLHPRQARRALEERVGGDAQAR